MLKFLPKIRLGMHAYKRYAYKKKHVPQYSLLYRTYLFYNKHLFS